jgi:hypothetical protein
MSVSVCMPMYKCACVHAPVRPYVYAYFSHIHPSIGPSHDTSRVHQRRGQGMLQVLYVGGLSRGVDSNGAKSVVCGGKFSVMKPCMPSITSRYAQLCT